jgi:hypothetical protein
VAAKVKVCQAVPDGGLETQFETAGQVWWCFDALLQTQTKCLEIATTTWNQQ